MNIVISHLKTEATTIAVVGQAADGGCSIPERFAAVSVSLVFLEQFKELQEDDPVSNISTTKLFQVTLLCMRQYTVCVTICVHYH